MDHDMRATMGMALRSLGHSPSSQQASDLLEVDAPTQPAACLQWLVSKTIQQTCCAPSA